MTDFNLYFSEQFGDPGYDPMLQASDGSMWGHAYLDGAQVETLIRYDWEPRG